MDKSKIIDFIADKVSFSGPQIDGGYKVTFHVGEFMQKKITDLMKIPQQVNLRVVVEQTK